MTDLQATLVSVLAARKIEATFNGRFLNGSTTIKRANGKQQKQSFGLVFDDAATLDGPCVTSNLRGTYAEAFARDAFFEAIRLGQGELEAVRFANECLETGVRSGASQDWIEANRSVAGEITL